MCGGLRKGLTLAAKLTRSISVREALGALRQDLCGAAASPAAR